VGGEITQPQGNDQEQRLLFKWALLFSLALPLPSSGYPCPWYSANPGVDISPADFVLGPSFDDALALTLLNTTPTVVWGDLGAYLYQDGSAPYAAITRDFMGMWTYVYGIVGHSQYGFSIPYGSPYIALGQLLAVGSADLPGICAS
jgi:hypothetical protein